MNYHNEDSCLIESIIPIAGIGLFIYFIFFAGATKYDGLTAEEWCDEYSTVHYYYNEFKDCIENCTEDFDIPEICGSCEDCVLKVLENAEFEDCIEECQAAAPYY